MVPRSIELLVEEAAKDRKEYVEARRMDMEVLDAESPHCSLRFVRLLPMRASYSSILSSLQIIFTLLFRILGASTSRSTRKRASGKNGVMLGIDEGEIKSAKNLVKMFSNLGRAMDKKYIYFTIKQAISYKMVVGRVG